MLTGDISSNGHCERPNGDRLIRIIDQTDARIIRLGPETDRYLDELQQP